jgi:hypothetical protein
MELDKGSEDGQGRRPWTWSLLLALLLVGAGVTLSVSINPLLDRRIHWDWTASLAVLLLLFSSRRPFGGVGSSLG